MGCPRDVRVLTLPFRNCIDTSFKYQELNTSKENSLTSGGSRIIQRVLPLLFVENCMKMKEIVARLLI